MYHGFVECFPSSRQLTRRIFRIPFFFFNRCFAIRLQFFNCSNCRQTKRKKSEQMPFLSCALWFGFSEADDRLIGTGLNLISEQFIGNGKKRNSTKNKPDNNKKNYSRLHFPFQWKCKCSTNIVTQTLQHSVWPPFRSPGHPEKLACRASVF